MQINLTDFSKVYFLGIGGIGMSALARYFLAEGYSVAGYDRVETALTIELIEEGCTINYSDRELTPPDFFSDNKETLIVYTPAIKKENVLLNYFISHGFIVLKRAEVLGLITALTKSLCVAGTHGKSTTSSLLAHILSCSNTKFTAFLGAIATNFNSNLVLQKEAEFIVVEADEFDRSFLTLSPFAAIVTSVDPDHLDIYGSKESFLEGFEAFAAKINSDGILVVKEGIDLPTKAEKITYALFSSSADYAIEELYYEDDRAYCSIRLKKERWSHVGLGLPGIHNAENALACVALLSELGVSAENILHGLKSFQGLKRRFETILRSEKLIFIDDYAHHPTEINALVTSLRLRFPSMKISGVFQPHLFSRTKDFANEFAVSLAALDEVILLAIYPARELPMEGVSSEWLLSLIEHKDKKLMSKEELFHFVESFDSGVFVTIGAGDIDRLVLPIKDRLISNLV